MRALLAVALLMSVDAVPAAGGSALRDGRGTVLAVTESATADGGAWTRVEVEVEGDGRVVLTIGPSEVLGSSGFVLEPGNEVRFRYFTGTAPFDVQRIRNESTGTMFRARCLHGDPVWFAGEGGRGAQGPQRQGSGTRGGRR